MYILGLDIGYSNLKLAFGHAGKAPRISSRPAGAAPSGRLGVALNLKGIASGEADGSQGVRVRINGDDWVAGIHSDRFERWGRPLHKNYPTTDQYRALFNAALLLAGAPRVDALVTGLPTAQWFDEDYRTALEDSLEGAHRPNGGREFQVAEVTVLPQPLGTYIDFLWGYPDPSAIPRLKEICTVIIDVGYYSTDWAVVTRGRLQRSLTGTSMKALAMVLDRAAGLMADDDGGTIPAGQIEEALAAGRHTVIGRQLEAMDFTPYLERAAQELAPIAIDSVCADLRDANTSPRIIILTGGGAAFFESDVRRAFPDVPVITARDQVRANARGYFYAMSAAQ